MICHIFLVSDGVEFEGADLGDYTYKINGDEDKRYCFCRFGNCEDDRC